MSGGFLLGDQAMAAAVLWASGLSLASGANR